ncbi:aldehyde dehydrogenase family protein [Thermasporomyces composti]|jgi:aldehyde dehydrogenase (NAD+)|uniref:Aldehyde dehydrogenase (NAD+) n=1 Tax=Thermasporomyces composti TaxID=696763 RepID=A0A3D9V4K2_THECX|nr:aldehyde dehydrogenase family protein [Thermasporomyces composti]REF36296.1 aldehyde dehydrogenase (NAD+) [Thermasporomyces composti]
MRRVDPQHLGNYIAGAWREGQSGKHRRNVNPADIHDHIGDFTESGVVDVEWAVDAAAEAFADWRARGPIARAEVLRRAGRLLEERREVLAATITREQGKRLVEARAEVDRALTILDFTVGEARRLNGVTTPAEDPRTVAMTFRRPIGVVGLITPWNFPVAIPMWKVAPALLSGCTAVLKPSPFTPLTAALLVQAFHDADLPPGVLNLVQGDRAAGEALVAHPAVAGVSFTGSLAVGLAIQQVGASRLLKTQLELGGKNALIVLDDAELDRAVDAIIHGAFGQAGQRCSATSRVIVDRTVKEDLLDRLVTRVQAMRVGPGTDPAVDVGPVVNEERLEACLNAIERAVADGATVACGGRRLTDGLPEGYYVAPTVLRDVPEQSEIAQEEIFGPVLAVLDCDGLDDAIRIANSVRYGMSGTVFTKDLTRAFEALDRLEAGMLHVNRPGVGAYAHLPHVGTKSSQYGPPECSPQVWDFYTEWRSACVAY